MQDSTPQQKQEAFFQKLVEIYGQDFAEFLISRAEMAQGLDEAKSYYQKLQALRTFYQTNEARILQQFREDRCSWYTSYSTDWVKLLTPIEFMAWQTFREKGHIVMYPQYPVLNYHVDFGNPGLKIALELDGKAYHNKEKDRKRDAELRAAGWKVFRITGAEMMNPNFKEWYDIEEEGVEDEARVLARLEQWLLRTGDGVIQAIKEIYFKESNHYMVNEYIEARYYELCRQTLEKHQL